MILRCGGTKEEQHYESEGKLYGVIPFAHCDTDCPFEEGTCNNLCSHLQINQRPCLRADYGGEGRIKIGNKREAEIIIEGIEALVKKGQELSDRQKYEYEFSKIFLGEVTKRKKKES
jgi:hypothetical protein